MRNPPDCVPARGIDVIFIPREQRAVHMHSKHKRILGISIREITRREATDDQRVNFSKRDDFTSQSFSQFPSTQRPMMDDVEHEICPREAQ
jgi:hypothetical protein